MIEQTIARRLADPVWNVAIVPQHAPGDNTPIALNFPTPAALHRIDPDQSRPPAFWQTMTNRA